MALQTARYLVASYDKLLKKEVYSEKDKNDIDNNKEVYSEKDKNDIDNKKEVYSEKDKNDIDNRKEVSRVEEEGDERMSIELRKREIKEGL